jgi:hypothetical protein
MAAWSKLRYMPALFAAPGAPARCELLNVKDRIRIYLCALKHLQDFRTPRNLFHERFFSFVQ